MIADFVAASGESSSWPCFRRHCAIIAAMAWTACCSSCLLIGTTSGGRTLTFATDRRRVTMPAPSADEDNPVLAQCRTSMLRTIPRRRDQPRAIDQATRKVSGPRDTTMETSAPSASAYARSVSRLSTWPCSIWEIRA